MHKFAFGVLGLSPFEYYCLSPYEYYCKCEGWKLKELNEWKRARWVSYWVYGLGAGKDAVPINKFLPLGDDDDKPYTKDEIQKMKEVFLKAKNGNGRLSTT